MKKFIATIALLTLFAQALAAATMTYSTTTKGVSLLTTNRMNLYSVEISSDQNVLVELFDCPATNAPYYGTNYTASEWVGRINYATNIASSFVGYNGYTNWYTNTGIFSLTVTNAASTNALTPLCAFTVAANTYAVYNVDAIFARGVSLRANTNSSVVLNYR